MNKDLKEKMKYFLYKQNGKSEVYMKNIFNNYVVGKVIIFTIEDLQEFLNIILDEKDIEI